MMVGELEALVGHLFVVGGRAVSAVPPGALVEQPPKRAQRGREQDTFFTLVTPGGSTQTQAAFYEQLARMAAGLYFRSSGSVTSGLREAISGVNNHLMTQSEAQRYQANILCLVLRGREIYVARAGACLSLLRQGDNFISAPDDPRDEYALNGLPLGYSPSPDIKLAHYEIAPGNVLILGDAGLAAANREKLSAALAAGKINAVQEALKPLAAPLTQAMIVIFEIVDPAAPVVSVPTVSKAPPSPPAAVPMTAASAVSPTVPTITAGAPSTPSAAPTKLPQSAQAKPLRSGPPAVMRAIQSIIHAIGRIIGGFLAGIARILNAILDRLLPEPEDGKPHIPATVAAGAAILIPVVVVFVMVGLRLSQVDKTNFEQMVSQIQDQAAQAERIPHADVERTKTAWLGILQRLESAERERPGDPTLARIRAEAQGVLDDFAQVSRRPATALRSFGANVKLGAIVLQGGADLYTLDLTQSAIYRDTLRQPDLIGTRGAQPIVQIGSAVSSYSVKNIVDMIWLNEGGIRTSHALIGLDTQGLLITYSPTFAPASAQPLQGAERWKAPIAVRAWQEKLYILDPQANQIWRYVPSGTTYPNPPEEYYAPEYQRRLANAVDFAIDEKGNIYVLFADGSLKKYNSGAEQSFSLNGAPEGGLKSANKMYLDSNSPLPAIFITDPKDESVYEFTLSGAFQGRFRATDSSAFKNLTSVFADGNNVYVTSGQVLYYFATGAVSPPKAG